MKGYVLTFGTVVALLVFQLTVAELFTSSAHLEKALYAERAIANSLNDYLAREEARLGLIRKLAEDYRSHSTAALANTERFLGNPVNAFLLIKKFTFDWDRDVAPVISNSSWNIMKAQIDKIKAHLPAYVDLSGAASAIMRLQDTYRLQASRVAQGDLAGIKSPTLSAAECFELGRLSYSEKDYYHTTLWMEQAIVEHDRNASLRMRAERRLQGEGISELSKLEVNPVEVLDHLAFSSFQMQAALDSGELYKTGNRSDCFTFPMGALGDVQRALNVTVELLKLDPNHERSLSNKKYFEMLMEDEEMMRELAEEKQAHLQDREDYRKSPEFLTYEALCRGEQVVPLKQSKLTCQYVSNGHPLLLLQPVKEEVVHLDPLVVIYHDVISDEEIRLLKHVATPKLYRATVYNPRTGELETANYRISKSAWLQAGEHPVVQRLNDRMAAVTGLDMETAEELQVANYGLGGHYEPHFDFATKRKRTEFEEKFGNRIATFLNYEEEEAVFLLYGTRNRIATFLAYMSDVEAGGATVFPRIGLKLNPKKGTAAFWYNLHRNGNGITDTRHAACPVLVGTKWIANKWIHEGGQEFRRPCSLNEAE